MTYAKDSSPPHTPWGLVVLLGSLTAMAPVGIDMYLPSLPAIGADLRASAAQTQGTVAAFLGGMAIGQFLYGPASDRVGRRGPILAGVAIFILASVGCALAASPEWLLVGRFAQALGGCAGSVVARAVIRDRFDHTETARMLSLMMLIMGAAPILAPLLGGALLSLGGWRLNFWFMAAFGVAIWLAAFLRLQESRSEETAALARSEHPIRSYVALLGNARLLGYALAGGLNGAVLFTYISSSPGLLIGTYGISPGAFGWVFGINAVGVIGANQVNRWLLRRHTPDEVLGSASLVSAGFGLLLAAAAALGGGPPVILPLLFLTLASYGLMQGNTTAGALSVDPRRAGSTSALLGTLAFAVGAAASSLASAFHDGTPRPMALVMLAALAGSATSLHLLALPKRAQA